MCIISIPPGSAVHVRTFRAHATLVTIDTSVSTTLDLEAATEAAIAAFVRAPSSSSRLLVDPRSPVCWQSRGSGGRERAAQRETHPRHELFVRLFPLRAEGGHLRGRLLLRLPQARRLGWEAGRFSARFAEAARQPISAKDRASRCESGSGRTAAHPFWPCSRPPALRPPPPATSRCRQPATARARRAKRQHLHI